jgi:hypothetical protein
MTICLYVLPPSQNMLHINFSQSSFFYKKRYLWVYKIVFFFLVFWILGAYEPIIENASKNKFQNVEKTDK